VPLATYVIAHYEATAPGALTLTSSGPWALVAGGLAYSAKTVFDWASLAFANAVKATGFVVLLEGVMVTSATTWLGVAALAYLISINAVATACKLSAR
jgi:hypothetical protein